MRGKRSESRSRVSVRPIFSDIESGDEAFYTGRDSTFYSSVEYFSNAVHSFVSGGVSHTQVLTMAECRNVVLHGLDWKKTLENDPYCWVEEDVKDASSRHATTSGGVVELPVPVWKDERYEDRFIVRSPKTYERVCHRPQNDRTIYMYDILFTQLGVRFPLNKFQMGVLRFLDCAPSQLHPNGWGIVRSFEVMAEHLGFTPTVALFFAFCRIMRRVNMKTGGMGFVTLRAEPKILNFKAFADSAKEVITLKRSYCM
ncbi:hypothetical protein RJT34_14791 [Clitoria ternatea]|uniref:Transposase (putative) gypsy type domain-containing protein n=1 Tax=Clitoria ternatea TaxID=43366 RepID=A0AAN9PNA7_CLITE